MERLVQQYVQNVFDNTWIWVACESVDLVPSNLPTISLNALEGNRLEEIDDLPHVSSANLVDSLHSILINFEILLSADRLNTKLCAFIRNRIELKSCATRQESWDNFGDVVGDQAEPDIFVVLFDDLII